MKDNRRMVTVGDMVGDLRKLGLASGMTVITHSSLSSFGWVCGSSQGVILALLEVLGPEGTLVMPTHSSVLSDPVSWCNPPVPEEWWEPIRQTMPAFRKDLTPAAGMGRVAETFRGMDGVLRSDHPKYSFAATGKKKEQIIRGHALDYAMGENSPLARLYEEDAFILLMGVGYDSCTALHLAEYRGEYPGKRLIKEGAPLFVNGKREWVEYEDISEEFDDFDQIGADFEAEGFPVRKGDIGAAPSRLIEMPSLVDFAVQWVADHRTEGGG